MGLRTLGDAHLQVDGVTHDIHLRWIDAGEHITIVVIVVAHSIVIFAKTLVHEFLVVYIATLHAKHGIQIIGIDHGITYPRDVTQVVFFALVNLHIDIHMFVVNIPHGVLNDGSVTESQFVVFLQKRLLGLFIAFGSELLGLEHVTELSSLMNLSECSFGK